MQEALPYKRWEVLPPVLVASTSSNSSGNVENSSNSNNNDGTMESLVKDNPVIVFGKRGCCMCHVVRKLLLGLGVNPPVFEIDSNANESLLINSLSKYLVNGGKNNNSSVNTLQFPLVFVGGELFGGLEKVMATHLSGELVPILKQAGALWL